MSRSLVGRPARLAGAFLVLPLAAAPFASPFVASAASPAPADAAVDPLAATEQLYALGATSGALTTDAAGAITLTLSDPDARIVRYADRPGRAAEWMSLPTFVAAWPVLFAGDPPNAVLSWAPAAADRAAGMLVLELGTPSLAADGSSLVLPAIAAPVSGEDLLATEWPDRSAALALGAPMLAIDGATSFSQTVGPVTVVGTPGPDSLAVSVTLDGTLIGSGTLTAAAPEMQVSGTVGGVTANVTLQAEIPMALQVGLLIGIMDVTGDPSGPISFDGSLGTWPGPPLR